jgi:hypothetical protein
MSAGLLLATNVPEASARAIESTFGGDAVVADERVAHGVAQQQARFGGDGRVVLQQVHVRQRPELGHPLGVPAIDAVGHGAGIGRERGLGLLLDPAEHAIGAEPGQRDGQGGAQPDVEQADFDCQRPAAARGSRAPPST